MWLLHFLPDGFIQFIVHAILLLGIVGCVVSFHFANNVLRLWPPFAGYFKMAQIASVILLVCGIYFEGGYSAEMQWRERVREVEAKLEVAQQESKDANAALAKKSKEKVKVIEGKQIIVKQYIDREVAKYNDQCVIPKEFVKAHNDSAEKAK